jgi:hypothetical protein
MHRETAVAVLSAAATSARLKFRNHSLRWQGGCRLIAVSSSGKGIRVSKAREEPTSDRGAFSVVDAAQATPANPAVKTLGLLFTFKIIAQMIICINETNCAF